MNEEYQGIIDDPRSDFDKSKDYQDSDLAKGEVVLKWREKTPEEWKKYVVRNQDGSSACVAFATAKMLGIHEVKEVGMFRDLSPKFIYTRRSNYPDGGMWLPNALDIACRHGACLETELPCENQGESYLNDKSQEQPDDVQSAKKYKAKYYFKVKVDIDKISEVIEQGYGVLLGMRFDYNEWIDVPFIDPNSQKKCGHGIPAIDYCIHNGEKALIIEDSWGPNHGKGGHRIITETFLKARCFYAGYITSLENEKFIFTQNMRVGSRGLEVKMLQERLNTLGEELVVDGKFGKKTAIAVMNFQSLNGLKADGVIGPLTRSKLNA